MNNPCSISLLVAAVDVDGVIDADVDIIGVIAVEIAVAVDVAGGAIDCSANDMTAGDDDGDVGDGDGDADGDAGFDKIELNASATGADTCVDGVTATAVAVGDSEFFFKIVDNANRAAEFDGVTAANGDAGDAGDDGEVLFKLDNANRAAAVDVSDTGDGCMDVFVCGVCDSFDWSAFNANAMTGDIDWDGVGGRGRDCSEAPSASVWIIL